jgi:hypothetical protein
LQASAVKAKLRYEGQMVNAPQPKSLLDGVEREACSVFGIAALRHRSALRSLSESAAQDLIGRVYRTIAGNYVRGGATKNKERSQENWRWLRLQPQIASANRSAEVVLERAIAAACLRAGRTDWGNQIPVASGLIVGASDGRRAIDLVHRCGNLHFEFIELKIASDAPLFAAVEIAGYACIWLLARADPPTRPSELLLAHRVDLSVLAPEAYFDRLDLRGVEAGLDAGMGALGREHGVTVTFRFEVLPEGVLGFPPPADEELLAGLAARRPLFGSKERIAPLG